jgi:hypothetical protein
MSQLQVQLTQPLGLHQLGFPHFGMKLHFAIHSGSWIEFWLKENKQSGKTFFFFLFVLFEFFWASLVIRSIFLFIVAK